jgi:hypothetical protein
MDEQNGKKVGGKPRIETQIHRRRKAKALSALEAEWDSSQQSPPTQLRMTKSTQRKDSEKE